MCAPACAAACPGLRLIQRGAVGWGRTHARTQADVDTPKLDVCTQIHMPGWDWSELLMLGAVMVSCYSGQRLELVRK
jgi:hypothetical protein